MSYLLLSMFCAVAVVAFSSASQLNVNSQRFRESSLKSMDQKPDIRYSTVTLYLTPSEMKALRGSQDSGNQMQEETKLKNEQEQKREQENEQEQLDFQRYNEQQQFKGLNEYKQIPSPVKEPKAELRGLLAHNSFYPNEENSNYANQQWNYDENSYSRPIPKEEQKQIYFELTKNEPHDNLRSQDENKKQQENQESEWKPFNPESDNKEKTLLYEQIRQQGNVFDQNQVQLKALSTISKEYENMKETNTKYNAAEIQLNAEEKEKSEIEKQIEFILRHEQAFEDKKQNDFAQREANKQKLPIIIHKEISVTKHHPVPVLRKVKVPTPVLVPIPEPYEVKIPYHFPVPYKVIKHIPVPVIRHY